MPDYFIEKELIFKRVSEKTAQYLTAKASNLDVFMSAKARIEDISKPL